MERREVDGHNTRDEDFTYAQMERLFNERFQRVLRSLLLKKKWNNFETITPEKLSKLDDEAAKRATELAFFNICALRSKTKLVLRIPSPNSVPNTLSNNVSTPTQEKPSSNCKNGMFKQSDNRSCLSKQRETNVAE